MTVPTRYVLLQFSLRDPFLIRVSSVKWLIVGGNLRAKISKAFRAYALAALLGGVVAVFAFRFLIFVLCSRERVSSATQKTRRSTTDSIFRQTRSVFVRFQIVIASITHASPKKKTPSPAAI